MNINKFSAYPSISSDQRGAVLIVVLLFLTLIMLAGVIAVRNSSTDLKLATSDQINTILLQSSDSVNNKIEQSVNGDPTSAEYKQIMSFTGIFGHYLINEGSDDDIIDFCYRPRAGFFNIDNAAIRRGNGRLLNNSEGYCNPTSSDDYTSARSTTMTQVMIKNVTNTTDAAPFKHMNLGSDSDAKNAKMNTFDIYSTSVLPAYGSANTTQIQNCFKKDASATTDNVAGCLSDHNIPNKMLVEQVDVANIESVEFCTYFAGEANPGNTSRLCKDS